MSLEDELVVLRLRELVGDVGDVDVELMDAIYCALDEVLERVAPELNRAVLGLRKRRCSVDGHRYVTCGLPRKIAFCIRVKLRGLPG